MPGFVTSFQLKVGRTGQIRERLARIKRPRDPRFFFLINRQFIKHWFGGAVVLRNLKFIEGYTVPLGLDPHTLI